MSDIETIVVGAGVVGLATARSLAMSKQEVMVLERHDIVGSETSSRNSEVIHAGIYYPPGSVRARLCVEGKAMLYDFLQENGVAHQRISKLLVATDEAQIPKLMGYVENARKNGVNDLQLMAAQDAIKLEPELACKAAALSPSTGIVDSHGLMQALEGHIFSKGGSVVLQTDVTAIAHRGDDYALSITTCDGTTSRITCRNLVLSCGLHVTKLARTLNFGEIYSVPETFYASGQYYALSGKSPFGRHIYPMPDGAWLGLHATIDLSGRCKFGPDIEWIPEIDYTVYPEKLDKFIDFIRSYYPSLDPSRLHADYVGVRPKLYREGEPVADFRIDGPGQHRLPNLVVLSGIESPGLTSSLAIGQYVSELLKTGDRAAA